jgi:3-phenylpropionate/trans-cinnamate dioxygenase ferredoxin reductase component
MTRTFVIAGAGLAGAKAAESLREAGFDGKIILLGAEAERPYERPELSKGFLQGTKERDAVFVHAEDWYTRNDVDLRMGAVVTDIDRPGKAVVMPSGERIGYDKLLLATGATPRHPNVPGGETACYLRTIGDAERLRSAISAGGTVVVVGGGWIGLETAAAARSYGAEVTVVEPQPAPLYSVLGPELGDHFARLHQRHGVELRLGVGVSEIRKDGVGLSNGERVGADVVVVGVGAKPSTRLAEDAGLTVGDGIAVNSLLQTSDPDIYAAGDVASAEHPGIGEHVRVEHWANALHQGLAVGPCMLGTGTPYENVPYFYTDQFDLGMEYAGHVRPGTYDRVVYRGDPDKGEFIVFWVGGGRVLAGMNVNVWDVSDQIQALVRAGWRGVTFSPDVLADPDVPLNTLVADESVQA